MPLLCIEILGVHLQNETDFALHTHGGLTPNVTPEKTHQKTIATHVTTIPEQTHLRPFGGDVSRDVIY